MKQTAVEWLVDWMGKNQYFIGNDLLQAVEQAKAMEREQMEEIHIDGVEQGYNMRYEQEKKMKHGKDV
jgi:hypothetical protein